MDLIIKLLIIAIIIDISLSFMIINDNSEKPEAWRQAEYAKHPRIGNFPHKFLCNHLKQTAVSSIMVCIMKRRAKPEIPGLTMSQAKFE